MHAYLWQQALTAEDAADGAPDHEPDFCVEVSGRFISLRGAPLMISPQDHSILRELEDARVPIDLAIETLEEVFARFRSKNKAAPRNLSYYRAAILSAWQNRQALLAPSVAPAPLSIDIPGMLTALAEQISDDFAPVRSALLNLSSLTDACAVEDELASLEVQLHQLATARLTDRGRDEIRQRLADNSRYLGHLDAAERQRILAGMHRQIIFEMLGLPRLSILA